MPAMIPHLQTIPPERRWRYVRGWALRHLAASEAESDTGAAHGPALPTGSQLADHPGIGFGRYSGPWIIRSGFRVDDGQRPALRRIPNPADLRRPA